MITVVLLILKNCNVSFFIAWQELLHGILESFLQEQK